MKMSAVLRMYQSEVEKLGKLQVCSKFTKKIKQPLDKFYTDMRNCASATGKLPPSEVRRYHTIYTVNVIIITI
jgi:hypothetical protein